ncbi:MAG TPA: alpha/beta hydrolase [Pseudonocardiaceae bacterium]|nr:alpha/beta hydrolase [Pseudonocardiaceae bacterium]
MDHETSLAGEAFQYSSVGAPGAPPLVLLHALGEAASDWSAVAAALADRYRVVALTQRGHGGSPYSGGYSTARMSDDLLLFADALGLDRFALIGHSMGGVVALRFAEVRSDRLTRLVVEDVPAPQVPRVYPAEERPDVDLPFDWEVVSALRAEMSAPDLSVFERLVDITVPTLVIGGGAVSHIPQEQLVATAERIPNGRMITIEGGGHLVHTEKPAEFLAAVSAFLAE